MAAENKPEGLKKIRNPERMVRIAVGYTGHTPPKSDDTDANNEPGQLKIYLPKKLLECLPKCSSLPKERHRWNTNEEIAAYLITFEKHDEWLTTSPKTRPQNGSMILYNRKKVKYRKDGYCWKKRKDGKTTREDHMKLKVQGVECLYGCYVHSSIIPTFHRRCYWLLQNPDIVLVHYLNVPAVDDSGKPCGPVLCSINTDRKEWAKWSKEELIGQLKPMCAGSSLHQKCSSVKQRIISSKQESGAAAGGGAAAGMGVAAGQRAEEADGTEVQNSDVSEGQTEPSPGGGRSRAGGGERRNGRINNKPSLLPQSSMEVSSSTSTNQVEVPDTTQSSPLSITSDMADSPALAIGAGLTQSTAVFMSEVTTLTGDSVYSAGHTHLLASTHESTTAGILLAVAPENQRFAAFPGGVGLGEGGELVLSSSLDSVGGVSLPETAMTFDPDCFLNNPKQGQTYGGGGGKVERCNSDDGGPHCSSNGFIYNPALVINIKTEPAPLELPLAPQSSYVGEGTGLSPSTTLEQMDFSAVMSSACVPSLTQPAHHPSPSLFLQTSPQTSQPSQLHSNGTEATQESGEAQVYIGLPTVPTETPVTNGDPHTHLHQASPDQQGLCGRNGQGAAMGSFPLTPQDTTVEQSGSRGHREVGGLDKTSENGGELLLKPGDPHVAYTSVDTEHYLQPTDDNGGGEEGGGGGGRGNEILCNGVSLSGGNSSVVASPQSIAAGTSIEGALYSSALPQQGRGVSATTTGAGAAISLEGFEASFGSQFSDLINDFISVEGSGGGVGAAVTGVLMPQEGAAGEEQGTGTGHLQGSEVEQGALGLLQETGRLFGVTDYSPEWSYPEGGVKVLITGPWLESSSEYSCLFDHISVPAALIQPGVLRCYCPAHDTGLVMLQVAMGGEVISSSVVFEYKARDLPALPSSQHDWLSLDDTQFRMSILERLEQMEQRMAEITNQNPNSETMATKGGGLEGGGGASDQQSPISTDQGSFEGRVVVVCEKMMSQPCWASSNQLVHSKNSRGMTLLHLAAAQGYAGLIQTLIRWRTKHADSIDLELEVDPLNVDHFSCTPLMWACALGHTEAALVLYQWDPRALAIPDSLGRLPLNIARSRGHTRLAELLEQLQQTPQAQGPPADTWMDRWRGESQTSGISNSPTPNPNSELRRARTESQPDNQNPSWSQTGHRAQQGTQGEQGGPPPAKRLKPSPDTQQQLANSTPGTNTLSTLLNSSPSPNPQCSLLPNTLQTQPSNLSCQNAPPASSSPNRPQLPSAPFSHLQARIGGSGGGTRWSLRQTLGQRSLARRILGKERLAIHLRQRLLSDRGEETELLTYQDNTEDLQMDITMLADHIMEASTCRLKQEDMETETDSSKVGISSDVKLLSGYLGEVERFLNSKSKTPSPKANPLSGPEDQQSPQARDALSSSSDWTSFLCAAMKEERLKTDSCLAMTEEEQGELYETIRHALHSLRKHKGPIQEQRKEIAAVIQRCYKRYKQYALYKRMTLAAILIQSRFRSFHEQRKFQQSRRAAVLIQQYYRSYRHSLGSLLTKKQNQAARKILRFLLRCRHSPLMDHRPLKRGQRAEKGQGS
ncbi:calmodulin-binding transcription activator 1-like isoform X1 [Anarrhichthys ocellatus]|uniref:calmodulin-binding transcription activator 1-like isoform X1 n=1 Tax=Anarrhichthys ocellatus TaxID=433405 RepID=UPI0012ECD42D|nr:calmodulin-binding transcription activator 1-like isoform X1 [Anarrhichthys ocellatus]XP_031695265.1 calmodulin-binding transcription activator 1-like isoform X1 [Anarrhichthys ocellatus]